MVDNAVNLCLNGIWQKWLFEENMRENGSKLDEKRKRGRPKTRHGGYSYLVKGALPERRKYLTSYLAAARSEICRDYGGEGRMSASQIILLDRAIGKLGVCRLMEEHAREQGILSGGELIPCLRKSYLAFSNSLRRDLEALKELGTNGTEWTPTVGQIIREFDRKKAAKEREDEPDSRSDEF